MAKAPAAKGGMIPTRNDLKDNAKQVSIGVLNACLADTVDLYNATRSAHWNIKGPKFHTLHELLNGFYNELQTGADDIAERVVQLGGTALGTTQVLAASTRLPPYPTDIYSGEDHLKQLVERYGQVAGALREGIDTTDEAGDAGTADLLTGQSRAVDKMLWMLEAHLQADR